MLQNEIVIKERHTKFVKDICSSGFVWALENKDGLAISSSWDYENDKGEPLGLICFWPDEVAAKACAKSEWNDYHTLKITLADFTENYCTGMYNDGILVGTNFDQNMFGFEINPLDLMLEISQELQTQKKYLKLQHYPHLNALIEDIENLING